VRPVLFGLAAAGLALLLVLAPVGGVSPASAAAFAPGIPDPLTVPGSVVGGATGNYVGTRAAGMNASIMAKMIKAPSFWNYVKSVQAGTGTATEVAAVAASKAAWRVPAVAGAALLKTVGGVGMAVTAFDVGGFVGNGAMNLIGVDSEGLVCGQASEVLLFFAHQDCTAWKVADNFARNAGQSVGVSGGKTCSVVDPGLCAELKGVGYVQSDGGSYLCLKIDFGSSSSVSGWFDDSAGGTGGGFSRDASSSAASWNCGPVAGGDTSSLGWAWAFFPNAAVTMSRYGVGLRADGLGVPVVAVAADPERLFRCTVTLSDGSSVTKDSASFKESDATLPGVECPQFPPEVPVRNTTIWEVGGGETNELFNHDTTPEYQAAATNFPECMSGTCMLDLVKAGTGSCFSSPDACAGWFSDPGKATSYTCRYGSHDVALSECTVYAPTFQPGAKLGTSPYGDPVTGEALPGSGPGTAVAPGVSVADPSQPRDCFPSGWGVFNPFEWVMKPVGCALQWAFVPRNSEVTKSNNSLRNAITASGVGVVIGIIAGWADFPITGDGCGGIPWHFQVYTLDVNASLLAACPGDPLAHTAGVVKPILTAVVITVGVLASARYIAAIFGYVGYGGIVDAERRQSYRDEASERRGGGGVKFR
jgi:hypothetical protein